MNLMGHNYGVKLVDLLAKGLEYRRFFYMYQRHQKESEARKYMDKESSVTSRLKSGEGKKEYARDLFEEDFMEGVDTEEFNQLVEQVALNRGLANPESTAAEEAALISILEASNSVPSLDDRAL
ncbi:hypothetical protein UA08_04576 [Talaromyces atroroseus]|uniref:Uncharacterized protein n=1 Tax=Talaromyces atroroseus TaxID=1441469 RepID=A0A225B0D0_TALAT|nr:hypothetical protein UA08_04576 [Talaromyces atroroseus]OKL60185.1 hypothetical protein UA08_04576 [Talaromyces atroroseus]